MNVNFVLLCSIIMIPMIFFVPIMYINCYPETKTNQYLASMLVALLVAIGCWLLFGNTETFNFIPTKMQLIPINPSISMIAQLCFYLYSVVMFTGTILQRVTWRFFIAFIPIWTLLVYAPIANLMWSENGLLFKLGALDFSGGLVVHLTAGLTSLVLSWFVTNRKVKQPRNRTIEDYIAVFFILTGWFGFNLAPASSFSNHGVLIMTNTLIAVIGATIGWISYQSRIQQLTLSGLTSGIICGLVTSTALVAYVSNFAMLVVSVISGITCHYFANKLANTRFIDPVDSFAVNGVGGVIGTFGLIIFASPNVNQAGAAGILTGNFRFSIVELLALITTIVITLIGCIISYWVTSKLTTLNPVIITDKA
ncbi:ammonium transporter [Lentilactobacillus sp. Marseille-Q4993]|uniref:ammonium transporter n=1 Tax=Lentilactobacillus sp. Marseille-Q4993 TaxID=3039492 RepID=UPI0024BC20BF|nr:ammonium transporter [Lentilactobacillus sp. Marseille-Q4993]